jgi:hypothetical protein
MIRFNVLLGAVALLGCRDTDADGMRYGHEASERAEERREAAAEAREEVAEAREERHEEAVEARDEARADLPEQTDEALTAQREAAEARAQLDALIARACTGVEQAAQNQCPIEAGNVRSVRNIDDGVALSIDATADQVDDIEQRMDCYLAHSVLRQTGEMALGHATVSPNDPVAGHPTQQVQAEQMAEGRFACIVDSPDVDIDVEETNGRVELEITADDDAKVEQLRLRARDLASHASR